MELDDLKQAWKQTDKQKPLNKNIMEMIQHKSYGPVAALKKSYKKQMTVMFIIPLLLLLTNLDDVNKALTSVMFWSYVAFCIAVIIFAFYNYKIASKMQQYRDEEKHALR